jgi:pimeloyl-ACP methyl ester carboxylesterase
VSVAATSGVRDDGTARLDRLGTIPTRVVTAALDRIALPRFGRDLAARISGARYREIPGAAHAVPWLDPATINDLLVAHLDRVERGPARAPG